MRLLLESREETGAMNDARQQRWSADIPTRVRSSAVNDDEKSVMDALSSGFVSTATEPNFASDANAVARELLDRVLAEVFLRVSLDNTETPTAALSQ